MSVQQLLNDDVVTVSNFSLDFRDDKNQISGPNHWSSPSQVTVHKDLGTLSVALNLSELLAQLTQAGPSNITATATFTGAQNPNAPDEVDWTLDPNGGLKISGDIIICNDFLGSTYCYPLVIDKYDGHFSTKLIDISPPAINQGISYDTHLATVPPPNGQPGNYITVWAHLNAPSIAGDTSDVLHVENITVDANAGHQLSQVTIAYRRTSDCRSLIVKGLEAKFTAVMQGVSAGITPKFQWSVTGGAAILGSNTGSSVLVLIPDNPFSLTVTVEVDVDSLSNTITVTPDDPSPFGPLICALRHRLLKDWWIRLILFPPTANPLKAGHFGGADRLAENLMILASELKGFAERIRDTRH